MDRFNQLYTLYILADNRGGNKKKTLFTEEDMPKFSEGVNI